MAELDLNQVRQRAHDATPPGRDIGPDLAASRARARRRPRWRGPLRRFPRFFAALTALTALVAVALLVVVVWGFRLTTNPHPDDPARVDALLVLYSDPQAYVEARELIDRGVADTVFVSAYLGPDGHERLCGPEAAADPRLRDVRIECFSPDPVTTQGEVLHARERMDQLGLSSLGVLTFPQHLERSRLLAERCWSGGDRTVSMYGFSHEDSVLRSAERTLYGTLAFVPVVLAPSCEGELPAWMRGGIETGKDAWVRVQEWARGLGGTP